MRHLDRMRVAEVTNLLAHVSGILGALPLAEYAEAIEAEASTVASQHGDGTLETVEGSFRRARRIELVAAAGHAQEFVACIQASMAHFRAARRAAVLEQSAADEATAQSDRPTMRAFSDLHAAFLRRAHPQSNVVLMHQREEALPDEPA